MYLEVSKNQYYFTQSNTEVVIQTTGENNNINSIMDLIELYVKDIKQKTLY